MSKKVLLAIPQLTGGGAERVVSVWANELYRRGYETSIILFHRSKDEYQTDSEIGIYSVADSLKGYLELSYPQRYIRIRKMLKGILPNYIISFLPAMQVWMMLASIGLHTKRIDTIRINPWRISVTNPVSVFFWKLCYRTSKKIILQASDQRPFFSAKERKKSIVIPNPISELYFESFKQVVSEVPTEFIAVGRIVPQKNYRMMIKGFAQVCMSRPNLRLRIFGTGKESYIAEIQAYISELEMHNNIFLMGRTPHIEEEYRKHDIYLMTSDYEWLPNALAEAMASQLVCISTDCKTGPKDLIDNEKNGFLIPVGDVNALTKTIRRVLLMSKEERTGMTLEARKKIMTYCSQENSVDTLCGMLKELK